MPYCPRCQQEADSVEPRCPLDQAFYVRSTCPGCGAEVFPKERFCGGCGHRVPGPSARVAAPLAPASVPARVAATLLDALALLVLIQAERQAGWMQPLGAGPLVAGTALAYFALLQSGAGQTLGQHVMGQLVLTEDRDPLRPGASLARTLLSGLSWMTGVLPLRALARPDGRTPAEVWTRTRTWSDRRP